MEASVPTFRSSCSIAARTVTNFGKSWALASLLILLPLYRSEVPGRTHRLWCRDFRSAVLDAGHHHVFDFEIFFHAVMRAFAADAGFLDAAEGGNFGGDQAGIDADHARLQRFRHPPDAAEIASIEIRREPKRRLVAHRDHVGFILET